MSEIQKMFIFYQQKMSQQPQQQYTSTTSSIVSTTLPSSPNELVANSSHEPPMMITTSPHSSFQYPSTISTITTSSMKESSNHNKVSTPIASTSTTLATHPSFVQSSSSPPPLVSKISSSFHSFPFMGSSSSGNDFQFYTSFHSFIHDPQARHAFMQYLQSRQNDENILLVNDVFLMRDRVRHVVRNLFNILGSSFMKNSSFQWNATEVTMSHSEWSHPSGNSKSSSSFHDESKTNNTNTSSEETLLEFLHDSTAMECAMATNTSHSLPSQISVTKDNMHSPNQSQHHARHSDQSNSFIVSFFSLGKSPKSPKSPDQMASTNSLMSPPNSPPHSHLFSLHTMLSNHTNPIESQQHHHHHGQQQHHSRHNSSNKSKSAFSSKSSNEEFLNYENNVMLVDSPTSYRRSSNASAAAAPNNSFSSSLEEVVAPSQRFWDSVNAMLQSVELIYSRYVNDNESNSTNTSFSSSSIQNYDLSSVKFISLNTTHTVLEHARKDYNMVMKIFNNTRCSFSNQDGLLENVMRFCNYMLYEKDHRLSEKDLEKLKKIVIADECLIDTLNDHVHSNEDIDSILKQEMFAQFKWYPFRDLMTNISQQLQVESFDEFKSTPEFEIFIRKQIQQLTSHYMYKLFVQNVGVIPAMDMNDYVLSKKKKRKSLVDVLLRRKGTPNNDNDTSSSSIEDSHTVFHGSHKSSFNESVSATTIQDESFVNALQQNYNSILMAMDHCDLKEWMSPIPIPKWSSDQVSKFLVNNCYFGGDGAVEMYCDRVQKKSITGLDLMCLMEPNQISKPSKETSQLFKNLKMKNHDHQQRFISNLKEFLQNQSKFRRKQSLLYHDLYQPLVNDEHIIIKVLSPLTDESRVFSVERSIPLEQLRQRIEVEFSNTKLASLMEGSLFELKSLYTSDGTVIKDQFQLSQFLSSENSTTISRRRMTNGDMFFQDIRDENSVESNPSESHGNNMLDSNNFLQGEDGFKKLYIQPSCDKKFQRRMVVY